MTNGRNDYEINIDYYDGLGNKYNLKKDFGIQLTNATLYQRLLLAMNRIGSVNTETIAVMFLAGTIAFIVVLFVLFRKGKK